MRIDELKKIVEKSEYRLFYDKCWLYLEKRNIDGADNVIAINLLGSNHLSISNFSGTNEDLKVLKAAIKFCETDASNRGLV